MEKEVFDKAVALDTELKALQTLWWGLFHLDTEHGERIAFLTKDNTIKQACTFSKDAKTPLLQLLNGYKAKKEEEFKKL